VANRCQTFKMTILGIFESSYNYSFLTIEKDSLILVKLTLWQTIKEMFYDFKSTIDTKGFEQLEKNIKTTNLSQAKNVNFTIVKNRFWKHKLVVEYDSKCITLGVLNRNEINSYVSHLNMVASGNFKIIEK
jgi:hypothetical protein